MMSQMYALPAAIDKKIKALIKEGNYTNTNEAVRDTFRTLLNVRPELRISAAIELYNEGEISLGKASEMIGVTAIEFKDILANRGIVRKVGARSKEELESM